MAISIGLSIKLPGDTGFTFQNAAAVAPYANSPTGNSSLIRIEETVPGTATAHVEIWDPTGVIEVDRPTPQGPALLYITDTVAGKALFRGWIQKVGTKVQQVGRWLTIDAVDMNAVLDTIMVGAADGINGDFGFYSGDGGQTYILIDPNGQTYGGDTANNVKDLFAAYWTFPYPANTTTYVETLNVNALPLVNGVVQELYWDRSTLRSALNDLCTLDSPTTVCWIDADGYVHLTRVPQLILNPALPTTAGNHPLARMLPQGPPSGGGGGGGGGGSFLFPAPVALTDDPTGAGVSYENFEYSEDSSGYMFSTYVSGATGWVYNPTGLGQVPSMNGKGLTTIAVPVVEVGGSGYVGLPGVSPPTNKWLQRYSDVPQAVNQDIRDTFGQLAVQKAQIPIVRGACDVVYTTDIWHAGMILTISNTLTGLDQATLMIQRCQTTIMTAVDGVRRRVHLEWGTAPFTRLGLRVVDNRINQSKIVKQKPATQWQPVVTSLFTQTYASQVVTCPFQLMSPDGTPWKAQGLDAEFAAVVFNGVTNVTSMRTFSFSPTSQISDPAGHVQTNLTMASDWQDGDFYRVYAITRINPAVT